MTSHDPFDLQRFVDAQAPVIDQVREELRTGHKRSHWMWFVFPQIEGLGSSAMSRRYAIQSIVEAKAYLSHPVLGPRLRECTQLVLDIEDRAIYEIFDAPDHIKFHSSMTLFAAATADDGPSIFTQALREYFNGSPDQGTWNQFR